MAELKISNQGDFLNSYIQAKDASTNVNIQSLTNDPVSVHMTIASYIAEQLALLNITFATLSSEIDNVRASKHPHNLKWYIDNVLNFQYGYSAYIDPVTNMLKYSTIDEDAKIIVGCTGYSNKNKIVFKVRRKGNTLLTEDERASLIQTITLLSDAEIKPSIENFSGDRFTINADVIYRGSSLSTITTNVNNAIETYLNNLSRDSKFYMDDLLTSIKSVENVAHVSIDSVSVLDSDNNLTNILIDHETKAGYGVINTENPGTINYKKEV